MALPRRRLLTALAGGLAGCATRRPRGSRAPAGDARLGLVGDVMLGRNVNDRFEDGPPEAVWGDLQPRLDSLDGLLLNLECCLSDRGSKRPGRTYHFRADPGWAIPALRAGNVAYASLANNHVLDFGPVALRDTLRGLDDAGIPHAGAGPDLNAALRPARFSMGDLDVAVIALTDRSPSYAAGGDSPGTAYARLDPRRPRTRALADRALSRARQTAPDLLVASLHWGPNWVTDPADRYRSFARWLVERGVDVVHGHSAHVIQGVETFRGRPILHDCGDFVDDYVIKEGLHNDRSFLFELEVREGRPETLRLRPVEIDDEAVHRASDRAAAWLRDRMRSLSKPMGTAFRRDGDGLALSLAPPES